MFYFFKILLIYFLERGEEREKEREREKDQCVRDTSIGCLSLGNLACNPGVCPDWESNLQPFGSQVGVHSTEPHQPECKFLKIYFEILDFKAFLGLEMCLAIEMYYDNYTLYKDQQCLHCERYRIPGLHLNSKFDIVQTAVALFKLLSSGSMLAGAG